jgi:carbon starvation protein CstA
MSLYKLSWALIECGAISGFHSNSFAEIPKIIYEYFNQNLPATNR